MKVFSTCIFSAGNNNRSIECLMFKIVFKTSLFTKEK